MNLFKRAKKAEPLVEKLPCPYCGKEMESGVIQTASHYIIWTPKKYRRIFVAEPFHQDDVVLAKKIDTPTASARLCRVCKKILLDIPDQSQFWIDV